MKKFEDIPNIISNTKAVYNCEQLAYRETTTLNLFSNPLQWQAMRVSTGIPGSGFQPGNCWKNHDFPGWKTMQKNLEIFGTRSPEIFPVSNPELWKFSGFRPGSWKIFRVRTWRLQKFFRVETWMFFFRVVPNSGLEIFARENENPNYKRERTTLFLLYVYCVILRNRF